MLLAKHSGCVLSIFQSLHLNLKCVVSLILINSHSLCFTQTHPGIVFWDMIKGLALPEWKSLRQKCLLRPASPVLINLWTKLVSCRLVVINIHHRTRLPLTILCSFVDSLWYWRANPGLCDRWATHLALKWAYYANSAKGEGEGFLWVNTGVVH